VDILFLARRLERASHSPNHVGPPRDCANTANSWTLMRNFEINPAFSCWPCVAMITLAKRFSTFRASRWKSESRCWPRHARHLQHLLRQAAKHPLRPPDKEAPETAAHEAVAKFRDPAGGNRAGGRRRASVASLADPAVGTTPTINSQPPSAASTGPAEEQRRPASSAGRWNVRR
jgi:hypothetical protein